MKMIKVLVLDDEKGLCEQLHDFFACRGYRVFGVTSGEDALKVIDKENPHVLFLDIMMPGVDGLEVLRHAKEKNDKVKVIMVTALRDEDKKIRAKELGADEYLVKPFDYKEIERLIIKMVNEAIREGGKI
jgi:two-component system response regulator (stage 0 sporulation protein F)